jgi:hypothetical protein
MSASAYLIPLITAAGGGVIGYFSNAIVHHWQVEDTAARWRHERQERDRDELRVAFDDYFTSRAESEAILAHPNLGGEAGNKAFAAVHVLASRSARLNVKLNDHDAGIMRDDLDSFTAWIGEIYKREFAKRAGQPYAPTSPAAPSDEEARNLARLILGT